MTNNDYILNDICKDKRKLAIFLANEEDMNDPELPIEIYKWLNDTMSDKDLEKSNKSFEYFLDKYKEDFDKIDKE